MKMNERSKRGTVFASSEFVSSEGGTPSPRVLMTSKFYHGNNGCGRVNNFCFDRMLFITIMSHPLDARIC